LKLLQGLGIYLERRYCSSHDRDLCEGTMPFCCI